MNWHGKPSANLCRLYQSVSLHGGVEDRGDELGISHSHTVDQVTKVAGFGVEAGQGVHFEEVGDAVADAEVGAGDVATAQPGEDRHRVGFHGAGDVRRQLG